MSSKPLWSKHKAAVGRWGVAVGVGLSAAWVFFAYGAYPHLESPIERAGIFAYFVLFFSALAYLVIKHAIWPHLRPHSSRRRIGIIALALGFSGVLMLAIPVSPPTLAPLDHQLEIVATGTKNPLAQGSEVWVEKVVTSSDKVVAPEEFEREGEWEIRDGILLSSLSQPARLRWTGTTTGDVIVYLKTHPWSGIVQLTWDGQPQTIDLYADPGDKYIAVLPQRRPDASASALGALTLVADWLSMTILVLAIGLWLATRAISPRRLAWLGYALPCIAVWLVYLLAFWPGILNLDSYAQWKQMVSGDLTDWHPAFHTLTNGLFTRLWLSPTAVVVGQVAMLSILVAWGLSRMRYWGASRRVVWATCAAVALAPANGLMVNTLVKDVPYSAAILLLTILLLEVVWTNGQSLRQAWLWAMLGLSAAAVMLYRHNGLPVAIGSLLVLLIVYRRYWKPLALSLVLAVLLVVTVRGPLYRALGVGPSQPGLVWLPLHQIAAHLVAGTPLTDQERAVVLQLRPDMPWPYDCAMIDPTIFDSKLNEAYLQTHTSEVVQLFVQLTLRRPAVNLAHLRCSTAASWRITLSPQDFYYISDLDKDGRARTLAPPYNGSAGFQLSRTRPLALPFERLAQGIVRTQQLDYIWLFWRPALYLYILLAAAFIAAVRSGRWTYLLVTVPIIFNTAFVAIFAPSQDFRFLYSTILVGITLSPTLLCMKSSKHLLGSVANRNNNDPAVVNNQVVVSLERSS